MLDKQISKIKQDFNNASDIQFKKIKIKNKQICLIFSSSITSSDNINDFILKKLTNLNKKLTNKNIYNHLRNEIPERVITTPKTKEELFDKINSGFTCIIFENDNPLAIETKKDLSRGVSEPLNEQTISGPKDALTENHETNIGLIRKRIKTNNLALENITIGKQTKTQVSMIYMKNIAEESLVTEAKERLKKINIDGILDSTYIRDFIIDQKSAFPTIETTERPDTVCMSLLDGKVCILVENSPYALIIPTFFFDLFHASEDNYQSALHVTITRIIRYTAFIIAILLPALYIAITTFNHETIPVTLLINFAAQRDGVPFPAIVEALTLTLVFEILRESDIRMPHLSGSAISILGAIVLGDAAVAAGIVSPIMVIVIALSAISSLIFSHIGMINAIRFWRVAFMLAATIGGIVGIFLAGIILIIRLSSLSSMNKPYLYPLIPLSKHFLKGAILKTQIEKETKRMPILTDKNYTRSKS